MARQIKHKGGKKLDALLKNAFKGHIRNVETGFFEDAKYDDGTPVAGVAAAHEFGDGDLPERPFFRQANEEAKASLLKILKSDIDVKNMAVDAQLAGKLGAVHAGHIQKAIRDLKDPPLKPQTIERKGSSNPLIDSGLMMQSVTHKANK